MRLGDIASAVGARLEGSADVEIDGMDPVETAGPRSLSFVANPRYLGRLGATRAGALILGPGVAGPGCPVLRASNPYLAFARALALFARPVLPAPGVDPGARVDPAAVIGPDVRVAAGVTIGAGARVGRGSAIFPGVVVYPEVEIGEDCVLHANVVLRERVKLGSRVVLGPGAVIGGDGFGFLPLPGAGVLKIQQIGSVEIGDDVEIGANTTIDRATIGVTRVERGAKIDNLVMVAHGCTVGEESLLAAQVGLAGSTVVGPRVQLGGQVGAAGHLTIGAGARAAARSGIANDVEAGATVGGYPAMDATLWRRVSAGVRRLPEILRRLRRLERLVGQEDPRAEGSGEEQG